MKDQWWLIWSIERSAWWKPNRHGYTELRKEAGRYSFEEACEIVEDANFLGGQIPKEAMLRDE